MLEKNKIHCVKNLPVGQNLYDKIMYTGLAFETNCSNTPRNLDDIINTNTIKDFLETNSGPLATPNYYECLGHASMNSNSRNVEYRLRNAYYTTDCGVVDVISTGMSKKFYKKWLKPLEGKRVFSIMIVLKALSSGKVKLSSSQPLDNPEICGNYLSNPADRKNLIDAIKFIKKFTQCESFKKFGIKFYDAPIPGCEHKIRNEDKYLECAIKHLTVPYGDFSGTCKMGPATDPTAVVNEQGLVHGLEGLRVVGRTIMPIPTSGGAGALTTMIAERCCDSIRKQEGFAVTNYCPKK